ncbi:hypothetical protein ACGFJT_41835 [Actinomadura geliboluensis]|uniref:hypothetical protein n=1 Tax=Actinomadura geliboluensis TaxID=882440 RepID=UPI00371E50CA
MTHVVPRLPAHAAMRSIARAERAVRQHTTLPRDPATGAASTPPAARTGAPIDLSRPTKPEKPRPDKSTTTSQDQPVSPSRNPGSRRSAPAPTRRRPPDPPAPGELDSPAQALDWIITAIDCGRPLSSAISATGFTPDQVADWLTADQAAADRLTAAVDRWNTHRSALNMTPARRRALNRWRKGDRTDTTRAIHNADLRAWRREQAAARLPPAQQRNLLNQIATGTPLPEAAAAHGLTVQRLFGRARWDQTWRDALDAALLAGRRDDIDHGTPQSYRWYRCRCPDCRRAKGATR